jgi:hypothetical protein
MTSKSTTGREKTWQPVLLILEMFKLLGKRKFQNRYDKVLVVTSHFLASLSYDELFELLSHTIV